MPYYEDLMFEKFKKLCQETDNGVTRRDMKESWDFTNMQVYNTINMILKKYGHLIHVQLIKKVYHYKLKNP